MRALFLSLLFFSNIAVADIHITPMIGVGNVASSENERNNYDQDATGGIELGYSWTKHLVIGFRHQYFNNRFEADGFRPATDVIANFLMFYGSMYMNGIKGSGFYGSMMAGTLNLERYGETEQLTTLGFAAGYQFRVTRFFSLTPEVSAMTPMNGTTSYTLISGLLKAGFNF